MCILWWFLLGLLIGLLLYWLIDKLFCRQGDSELDGIRRENDDLRSQIAGLSQQANDTSAREASAASAQQTGLFNAAGTLLTGASRVASRWDVFRGNGSPQGAF